MKKIAVDTNILARLLANEDSPEARYAESLLGTATLYVSTTVLLETEWVLRGVMRIDRPAINRMIGSMLELPLFEVEQVDTLQAVLPAHADGTDFADAFHVINARHADAFATFDRDLVKYAKRHFPDATITLAS
ncbi:type II toxin-antitoxin system VapC family toxin [Rhizobium sp. LjRoot30]|uniref:type II toxin-antitoxin system VapC family toxin n=1 Tax=Rhizobium sp. LjRoot30 TaxID=3342320 RepID=UPI003ED12842